MESIHHFKKNIFVYSGTLVFMKAPCFRSKKKNAPPYSVMVAVDDTAHIVDGTCDCPAGKAACNHLIAVLRTVMLLQKKGFLEAPDQLSCTDLPQQWRVPRGEAIKGCAVQSVDWRKVKEGGASMPRIALPKERRVRPRNIQQQEDAKRRLAMELLAFDPDNDFAKGLLMTHEGESTQSRFGLVSSLCPQSYQMSLLPHGFEVLTSGVENVPVTSGGNIPPLTLFATSATWTPPAHLTKSSIVEVSNLYTLLSTNQTLIILNI